MDGWLAIWMNVSICVLGKCCFCVLHTPALCVLEFAYLVGIVCLWVGEFCVCSSLFVCVRTSV